MKTVSGKILSSNPISLSKAASILNNFASAENGASKSISTYIRRASAAFNDLNSFHKELKSASKSPRKKSKSKSNVTQEAMQAGISDTREEPNQTTELRKEQIHGAGDDTERKKHKKKREDEIDNALESKFGIEKLNYLPNEQNHGVDANTGVNGEGKKRKKNVVNDTRGVNGGLVETGFVTVKTEIEVETEIEVKTEALEVKADRKKRKSEVAKEGGEIASEENQIKKKRRKA